jgi:hypothetical protein
VTKFVPAFSPLKVLRRSCDNERDKEVFMNTKRKDTTESTRIRRLVRSKPKQCYANAARGVLYIPDYANADYVEGLAVIGGAMVIEHGWIERDGMIIDPTLPHDDLDYFPGLRFKGQRGLAEAMKIPKTERTREDFPIFYRFGWGGIDSPEFRAALIAAYRQVGMEDLARRYEGYGQTGRMEILTA